jgi:hypothetical protein
MFERCAFVVSRSDEAASARYSRVTDTIHARYRRSLIAHRWHDGVYERRDR